MQNGKLLRIFPDKRQRVAHNISFAKVVPPYISCIPTIYLYSLESCNMHQFLFQRVGKSDPTGAGIFGITWKTVDSDAVTIEISGAEKSTCRLVKVLPSNYAKVKTQGQLDHAISLGEEIPFLHLAAANDEAAGSVFGVINQDKRYLLKVTDSEATVSTIGTTVTLTGEYKH